MPFSPAYQAHLRLNYICSSPIKDAKGSEEEAELIVGHDIYPQWSSGLSNGTTRFVSSQYLKIHTA
jgi:hypothetical protein